MVAAGYVNFTQLTLQDVNLQEKYQIQQRKNRKAIIEDE
jgi:hypothetical protein